MTPTHGTAAVYDADAGEWVVIEDGCLTKWACKMKQLEHDHRNGTDKKAAGSYAGSHSNLNGEGSHLADGHNALAAAWCRMYETPEKAAV